MPKKTAFDAFMVAATQSNVLRADLTTAVANISAFIITLDAGGREIAGSLLALIAKYPDQPERFARQFEALRAHSASRPGSGHV